MTSPTTTRNKEGESGLVGGGEDAGLIFTRQKPPDLLLQCSMVTTVHPNLRGHEQHPSQRSHPQAPWHEQAVHQVLFASSFGFLPREEPGGKLQAGLRAGLVRAGMLQTLCWGTRNGLFP